MHAPVNCSLVMYEQTQNKGGRASKRRSTNALSRYQPYAAAAKLRCALLLNVPAPGRSKVRNVTHSERHLWTFRCIRVHLYIRASQSVCEAMTGYRLKRQESHREEKRSKQRAPRTSSGNDKPLPPNLLFEQYMTASKAEPSVHSILHPINRSLCMAPVAAFYWPLFQPLPFAAFPELLHPLVVSL